MCRLVIGVVVVAGVLFGVAAPAAAQVTLKAVFTQDAPTLAEAQGYTYRLYESGQPTRELVVTCSGVRPFACAATVSAMPPGPHTVTLTTGNAAAESAHTAPVTFEMPLLPSPATGLTFEVTIHIKTVTP